MLSSFTRDLTGAPDGYDAFFLVESFPKTLGHAVIFHVLENLNGRTQSKSYNQIVITFVNILTNITSSGC